MSYVIPSPSSPVPYLTLPSPTHARNGAPHPILLYTSNDNNNDHAATPNQNSHDQRSSFFEPSSSSSPSVSQSPRAPSHPQHSLGVPALALDCSTQLAGQPSPQGILYTGGRDGLVAGWELGVGMERRPTHRYGYEHGGRRGWVRWNELGGGDDDEEEDDYDDEEGDRSNRDEADQPDGDDPQRIPYEQRWEVKQDQTNREQQKVSGRTINTLSTMPISS